MKKTKLTSRKELLITIIQSKNLFRLLRTKKHLKQKMRKKKREMKAKKKMMMRTKTKKMEKKKKRKKNILPPNPLKSQKRYLRKIPMKIMSLMKMSLEAKKMNR